MADGTSGPSALIDLRRAIVVARLSRARAQRILSLAVLDNAGNALPEGNCSIARQPKPWLAPNPSSLKNPEILPGTWFFGGFASHHFGHQITRSLGRLQGLAAAGAIDGILYAPLTRRARNEDSQQQMANLFAGLGINAQFRHITSTTQVERLVLAPDLFSEQTNCVADPAFVAWARTTMRPKVDVLPGSKLYVSRSRLDPTFGRILCEDVLQKNLVRAGYQIYVPEMHALRDQIDTYARAETIVTTDGSQGHIMAFARQPGQTIITIARRVEAPVLLLNHLDSFGIGLARSQHHYIKCLIREWWPPKRSDNLSLGECDFSALFDELVRCGALDSAAKASWAIPTSQEVEASKALGLTPDDRLLTTEERFNYLHDLLKSPKNAAVPVIPTTPPTSITYAEPKQMAVYTFSEPATEGFVPQLRAQGLRYFRCLKMLHQKLRPDWYLEIGTFTGSSLRFAEGNFAAIDPAFHLNQMPPLKGREMIFFQDTSDAFFESTTSKALTGKINLAFLDGLHHYEVLLRDFMNVEPLMAPGGMVVLHDCLPYNVPMADRVQPPNTEWTGDVWKTLLILMAERPDLQIDVLDAAPTGLIAIRKLDPANGSKLQSRYKSLIKKWDPVTFDTHPGGLPAFWDSLTVIPARQFLDSLPQP